VADLKAEEVSEETLGGQVDEHDLVLNTIIHEVCATTVWPRLYHIKV
jgi:hypothetical protein